MNYRFLLLWVRLRYFLHFDHVKLLRHDPSRIIIIIILLDVRLFLNHLLLYYLRPLHYFRPFLAQQGHWFYLFLIFFLLNDLIRCLIFWLIICFLNYCLLFMIDAPLPIVIICLNLSLLRYLFEVLLIIIWLMVILILVVIVGFNYLLLAVVILLLHRIVMHYRDISVKWVLDLR